jgi:hypothetical protein
MALPIAGTHTPMRRLHFGISINSASQQASAVLPQGR